jgi:hypothetical protein
MAHDKHTKAKCTAALLLGEPAHAVSHTSGVPQLTTIRWCREFPAVLRWFRQYSMPTAHARPAHG